MKQISRLSVMAVIVSTMTFASCADDVYDPERGIQTEPKENPLGEEFSAPDGFDWSMINAVKLNVEVKDELNGSYEYLIEVFTDNPLSNENAAPIAAGVANKNKNYTAEVNLSKAIQNVYISQTDPKQRKEIYTFNVPENGGALDCKLYYEGVRSRAAMRAATSNSNSAFEAAKAAGITEIADKNYTEEEVIPSVPAKSDDFVEYNPGLLAMGAKFIIGEEYTDNKPFTATNLRSNGKAAIFVKGIWKLSGWSSLPSSLDIYIMDGGKIIGDNLTFEAGGSLTVAHGGSLECTANLNLGCPTKVFGSITANDIKMNSGQSPELFNKGAITATNEILINGSNVINHHTLKANSFNFVDSRVLNKANIESETSITLNSAKVFNYNTIKFNAKKGTLQTNNTTGTVLVNHNEATVTGYHINCGMSLYNDGLIEASKCTNNSVDIIYNSCTMIIKEAFTFRSLTLNKGSITAGRSNPTDTEWLPVPTVTSLNDATLTLIDGSMIKAFTFEVNSGLVTFTAKNLTNDSKSMIKVKEHIHFSVPNTVSLLGNNLVIEGKKTGTSQWNQFAKDESVNTGFDESKYTIETCGGIFNEGNEGEAPSNPQFPVITEDADIYTFAFEDNWPVYGDFDMNDLILTLTKKNLKINKSGNVENLSMFIEIRAVGANKNLAVGIRFTKLPKGLHPDKFDVNKADAVFEEGQEAPTYLLTTNAHNTLWTDVYTGQERRINTIIDGPTQKNPHKFNINMDIPASANVKAEDLNINNIDIFIITAPTSQKGKRTEVHVAGFAPTELGGTHYLGSGNDNSSINENRYYLSKENLAWAIVVPQEFAWPQESRKITNVYNLFEPWIVSGGQKDKDWYKSHNENIYPIGDLTPVN